MSKQLVPQTFQKSTNYAVALAFMFLPAFAFAAEAPDVSKVVEYLALAVAAIGAIGAAKMIPSAAIWLWTTLSSAVKRG